MSEEEPVTDRRDAESLPYPLRAPSALEPSQQWAELRARGRPLAVEARELRAHEGLLTAPLRELPVSW